MTSNAAWILVKDRLPEPQASVWYFFERTGVSSGEYWGEEDGLPTFGGPRGFLGGDVTHWQPRNEGDIKPSPPPGYSYPERAFFHGLQMPFDSDRAEPETQFKNPARAAALGFLHMLEDRHAWRWPLRQLSSAARQELVATMTHRLSGMAEMSASDMAAASLDVWAMAQQALPLDAHPATAADDPEKLQQIGGQIFAVAQSPNHLPQ